MTPSRRSYLAAVSTAGIGFAGCLAGEEGAGGGGQSGESGDASAWLTTSLTDVLTDETFTLDGFDGHVFVQGFAVWCSVCSRQESKINTFRQQVDDVAFVNINVDPNEDESKVRQHAEDNGYDWRWAVPPASFTRSLVEEFGDSITVPPNAPMVLVCPDGSYRRLENGVKPPDQLQRDLDDGC